ncbi:Bug family tripartite tricarboxylate transporter substrate binding protein [Ramlibacter sp.]|uniref:Bug family tripartite tricarboxylate transporter substrate binding protein n=1 Tax=Ramlibacter sp. TaxID=1917967 RepID=UPI003D0E0AB0
MFNLFNAGKPALASIAALACAMLAAASPASAQEAFPSRPVNLLIPYGPGAASDVVARIVGDGLARQLKQTVVPVNRPGGSGMVMINSARGVAADGYTLMFSASAIAAEQVVRKGSTFDVRKDVIPVARVSVAPLGVFVSATLPVNSVEELVAYARRNPGKLTYASPGVGSVIHLNTERFRLATKTEFLHVPYPAGTAPVLTALVSGDVGLYINEMGSMKGIVADKRVKVLATLADVKSPIYPDAPAAPEINVPELRNFTASFFYGIYVAPGTPPDRVEFLNRAVNRTMEDPEVRTRLNGLGYASSAMGGMSTAEFRKLVNDELTRTEAVVRDAGIAVAQ